MPIARNSSRAFWLTFLALTIPVSVLALYQAVPQLAAEDIAPWRSKWTLILLAQIVNVCAGLVVMVGLTRGWFDRVLSRLESLSFSGIAQLAGWLVALGGPVVFWLVRFSLFGEILPQLFPGLWIFLWLALASALALKVSSRLSLPAAFLLLLAVQGMAFRVWGILGDVTDFPFTLEYSETSRFYYASLPFSSSLYGLDLPLSTLHPSRYLLQSLPFVIPSLSLEAHRLWQALLWIGLTGLSAWSLARRMRPADGLTLALVTAWGFVFFLQGAVYYHLQVCVIIVLLSYSRRSSYRTLLGVLLASAWAGISRVNWFPVPAMLAIALYLLEEPVSAYHQLWAYLKRPVLWAVSGLGAALLGQGLYIIWSGNADNAQDFGSSFTSDLLWDRLLPNVTYPLGVLPAIVIVSLPLGLLMFHALRGQWQRWHVIRWLGVGAMLAVLFAGGLVVSTKIGGGGDIHNMDAFMVLLAVVAVVLLAKQAAAESEAGGLVRAEVPVGVLVLGMVVPVVFAVQSLQPHFAYDRVQAEKDLAQLRAIVEPAATQGGEVLFISERHLVIFDMVTGVQLVPDYEIVTLMEMAMSGNRAYLERFDADLASHRFAVIVTRQQRVVKKENEPFAEENNVWIDAISRPLLCYYERRVILESSNTLILTPKTKPEACP